MSEEKKKGFTFNCTKCGNCCAERGPIPLTMEDLVLWAKNNAVQNVMPYLKFLRTPHGTLDLVLARKEQDPYEFLKPKEEQKPESTDKSCPMYNKETKLCLMYENRPLSCRTYPLEYNGERFMAVDAEVCPGIGEGENTKEQRIAMKDTAKKMNEKLTEMRIAMPIFSQAIQPFVLQEFIMAQQEMMKQMENMPPEERAKFEEMMKKEEKTD